MFPCQPRLIILGTGQVAVALVPLRQKDFPRPGTVSRCRRLILAWPAETFERIGLDSSCYVCLLSHDPKFDEPALQVVLPSTARYVGAIGSKKTQAARRDRLREIGLTEDQIGRLHGPIGLDLGGRQP